MVKNFLSFMMFMCCFIAAMAVPARPGWQTVQQSDGTTLKVQTVGNAFNGAILTEDGLMVERGTDGDFYYISAVTGLTAVRAHNPDQRTASESAFVGAQRQALTMQARSTRLGQKGMLRGTASNVGADVPALGERRIPIILVEFADKKFNNTREEIIDAMLTGDKSVGQYFRDQSNGKYQPQFDVYGIYCLSQNREFYGGHSSDGSKDKALGAFVTEACELAAADGVSFKPYDTDNDAFCDVVIVIYAGVSESSASTTHPEAIWPCHWNLSSASYYSDGNGPFAPSPGDPYVNSFAVFNELYGSNDNGYLIDGIGTFAHEFSHCLGLPDFYDTGGGGHYGMGYWDLLCLGCYNDDGFTPPGYSAYEKVFMGWVDYVTPLPGTYYTLPVWNQKNEATDKAVCIVSDLNPNEYFILEYRKRQGWDSYLSADGIMITHVTFNSDRWGGNTVNNQNIQLMTLMNADNSWSYYSEYGDLWPRYGKNAFTDTSSPAAKLNMTRDGSITGSAGYLGKPVTDMVINSNGTASFWFMKDAAVSPTIHVTADAINCGNVLANNTGTKTFNVQGQALTGNVTLTLNDAEGVFSITPTVISSADASTGMPITVTFSPKEIRDYNATVTLCSADAQDVVVTLTGHGQIEGYTPVMQPANERYINLTQFRADWADPTPADNVASYTLEVSTKPLYVLLDAADFSQVPDALTPDGNLIDISSDYSGYLPDGWTAASYVSAYNGALLLAFSGAIVTPAYDFSGYDKMTVYIAASAYYYTNSSIIVSTANGSEEVELPGYFDDYLLVFDCAPTDRITIRNGINYTSIREVQVFAGDLTALFDAKGETGDDTYRLITGITDPFYTVRDLTAGGTFLYKVKSLFTDGTESEWSNVMSVTLFENTHSYEQGDVNHDEVVDIRDVTSLIDYVLSGAGDICTDCANINGDEVIDISDVILLIDMVLSGT